jgi:signal transduction histidine kinase
VLIVEDAPETNRYIAAVLRNDYRTTSVFDGAAGLAQAVSLRPDLIITDVMMPKLKGDQLVRELRARPETSEIPILALSANAESETRVKLLRAGAQDFLEKPFQPDELKVRVDNLVAMSRVRRALQHELKSQGQDIAALTFQLIERRRDVELAMESMRIAREQAEQASRAKAHFLGLVSHELRTPLMALEIQFERLERNLAKLGPPGDRGPILVRINASKARLTDVVESLLGYSAIYSGRMRVARERFQPALAIETVLEESRTQAEQKGLELRRGTIAATIIDTDPKLFRLVVVNLVGNAIKYTSRGFVEVSAGPTSNGYQVTVRDTGPGIPADEQVRIFEPFEQLAPVRAKRGPGVGLGLALVKEIAASLGAQIRLESEVGTGSAFTIEFAGGIGQQ